jgi:carbonic anhydrase
MSVLKALLTRNLGFSVERFAALPLTPSLRTLIVSCADPRVDPAHILGLEPGEAVVIRNVGGRITPATLQTLAMLQTIAKAEGAPADGSMQLIVLHHTDCGITRLEATPDLLAAYFGVGLAELSNRAVHDPRAAVAVDVALLRANPRLPRSWAIAGLVYNVGTGRVEMVVPPEPQA